MSQDMHFKSTLRQVSLFEVFFSSFLLREYFIFGKCNELMVPSPVDLFSSHNRQPSHCHEHLDWGIHRAANIGQFNC
jgi:hypothetical protein